MSLLTTLTNYMSSDSSYETAYGADITPTLTSTWAQNVFASSGATPNYTKPQSMFKVYFSLNPMIGSMIDYKKLLVEETTNSELLSNINQAKKSKYQSFVEEFTDEKMVDPVSATTAKTKTWLTKTNGTARIADLDNIIDLASLKVLSYEMGKMCKGYSIPNISMKTKSFNEYNRRRKLYAGNSEYGDLTLTFFDVKENPVQQFIFNYLKFINNDFFMKGNENWFNTFSSNKWNQQSDTGSGHLTSSLQSYDYNPFGFTTDSNIQFIQSISICEFFMDKCMVYTIINPKIISIEFGNASRDSMNGKDIRVTFSIEGITNDMTTVAAFSQDKSIKKAAYYRSMVNAPISKDLAGFFQTRYLKTKNLSNDIFNSLLNTYVNGEKKFSWNNVKQQIKETSRMLEQQQSVNLADKYGTQISQETKKNAKENLKILFKITSNPTCIVGKSFYKTFK